MSTTRMERIEAALDAALGMTFPASDPVALYVPNEPRSHATGHNDVPPAVSAGTRGNEHAPTAVPRTSARRIAARTLAVALAAAFALQSHAPLADDRETYMRAAAQREVATFDALDRDGDGRLTMDEALGHVDLQARFTDIDIDRDGVITRAELVRYVKLQYGVAI